MLADRDTDTVGFVKVIDNGERMSYSNREQALRKCLV